MGNLAEPLLAALGVNKTPDPSSIVGTVPPENGMMPPAPPGYDGPNFMGSGPMSEAVMGFPSIPLGNRTVSDPGPVPAPPPGYNEDPSVEPLAREVRAVSEGFKPKKISFWGALGDQLLKHWGNEPAFQKNIDNKNMRKAMKGFTTDPMGTMERLSQIPGMETKAWDLFDKYTDNQRMQGNLDRQNRVYDSQNERIVFDRTAGMMGAANDQNWTQMRDTAIMMAKARGVDVSYLIPEQYDPDSVKFMQHGVTKPKDQWAAEDRSRNIDSQIEDREVRQGQADRRLDQGDVRIVIAREAEKGRDDRYNTPKPKAETKPGRVQRIRDSSGNIRVVEYNSDGTRARSQMPDGTIVEYVVEGNELIKIKTIPPKGAK